MAYRRKLAWITCKHHVKILEPVLVHCRSRSNCHNALHNSPEVFRSNERILVEDQQTNVFELELYGNLTTVNIQQSYIFIRKNKRRRELYLLIRILCLVHAPTKRTMDGVTADIVCCNASVSCFHDGTVHPRSVFVPMNYVEDPLKEANKMGLSTTPGSTRSMRSEPSHWRITWCQKTSRASRCP